MESESLATPSPDPLLDLELRVARRADELVRGAASATPLPLHWWLCAEREVLGED